MKSTFLKAGLSGFFYFLLAVFLGYEAHGFYFGSCLKDTLSHWVAGVSVWSRIASFLMSTFCSIAEARGPGSVFCLQPQETAAT